jgi:FKBP-type peptidyl-prolyl cis-trans isomerase FklB
MRAPMAILATAAVAVLAAGAAAQEVLPTNKSQQQAPALAQLQPPGKTEPDASAASRQSPTETPLIQSRKDKISYAFGLDLARSLKRQTSEINIDVLMKALADSLAGKPLIMTDEEATATLKKFQVEQKQDYEHARTMLSEKNKRAGASFFIENARKEGVVTLPSGLQYKVLTKGDGQIPTLEDKVMCHYRATLLDGKEFDSSYKRNGPATLPVKPLIKGWSEALQLMPVGSKWQIFIPPQLAYGERIVGGIGPNATVILEVELLSTQKPEPAKAEAGSQPVKAQSSPKVEHEPRR